MRDFNEFKSNLNDINLKSGIKIFNKQLQSLEGSDIQIDGVDTRGIILNHMNDMSDSKEDRGLNIPLTTIIKKGSYIKYNEEDYMSISDIDKHYYYKTATIRKCNQLLSHFTFKTLMPCLVSNDSYGSKLLSDNEIVSMSDEKCNIIVQANPYTLAIEKNTRFMFMNNKNAIFKVFSINVAFKTGMVTFICKKDLYLEGLDDLQNNKCYQYDFMTEHKPTYDNNVLYGSENIVVDTEEQYVYVGGVVSWSIDNSSVCTMTAQSNNACTIKALKPNEIFTLTAKVNNVVVASKLISTSKY